MTFPERIVPAETEPGVVAHHLKRYEFSEQFATDRVVLDAGCGVGYGTHALASKATRIVGIDSSETAIAYAREHYAAANAEFAVMDVHALDLADASFDLIVSFELIEHLDDRTAYLAEMARVLKPDGTYIVSTPQVRVTTHRPDNPFHRIELSLPDFAELLRTAFAEIDVYGQKRPQTLRHRLIQSLDVLGLRRRVRIPGLAGTILGTAPTAAVTTGDLVIERTGLEHATELVAVCRGPIR